MGEPRHLQEAVKILAYASKTALSLTEKETLAVTLASHLLAEANRTMTWREKRLQKELARMMQDPIGKAFTMSMTDQCFRSHRFSRVANQLVYLLQEWGLPKYLSTTKRASLALFQLFGKALSFLFVPLATFVLRQATSRVILPGNKHALKKHMTLRKAQGVRLNLNHLGEAILGEGEAKRRLDVYLKDLADETIEYISVKISTIYSQIHLLGWDNTIEALAERLRQLYRVAMHNHFIGHDGKKSPKFVNLDMEEYRDLVLTKELFKKVLSEPEFRLFSAGIVLQAYLPDAHEIQKELTQWALERQKKGGAPIKIRIVKGANLAMEQFEASVRDWPQAPYMKKSDVDANYKKMVTYGCLPPHAKAVHLGVASHNLFDIAYAMLLRAENQVEKEVNFEMLEGMADHIRRVVQKLTHDILLYCPVATKEDFQSAIAYLIRRLDENTGPDNFLRHTFGLTPGSQAWEDQVVLFTNACRDMHSINICARRTQDRNLAPHALDMSAPFENEADTDFSLARNRLWAEGIIKKWQHLQIPSIPLVIEGKQIQTHNQGEGYSPSHPTKCLYQYALAEWKEIDAAIKCAKTYENTWKMLPIEKRCHMLANAAQAMREKRGDLIGAMMADGGKTILEADPEVSEAIDFAEYYLRSAKTMYACPDMRWEPKGTILITPPWNFPVSIPAGGILAALVTGNCVLFKPAPEAVLSGWELIKTLWEAGIPKEALQFINCLDEPTGSQLIKDTRLNGIILTGATATATLFMRLRPDLYLTAETGGKNAIIVTGMADRDLAIKEIVQSAFGHAGQKCSACSLLILENEVYDDPHFHAQLKDAVMSLKVGPCWDPSNKIPPLIRPPGPELLKGLTTLDKGESWLVKPMQDPLNHNLWTPGIKLGVKPGSFSHRTEFFGPLLSVMRAKDLHQAIELANSTPYGLTSGIQSLDDRELHLWMEKIEAGNCYINRGITGAIVRRQPFGGTKASSFGPGAKAGGPHYIMQFATPYPVDLPQEKHPISPQVNALTHIVEKLKLSTHDLGLWYGSLSNYAYWADHFAKDHDPSRIIGQDNLLRYRPRKRMCLRIQEHDAPLDILRVIAAILSCHAQPEISWENGTSHAHLRELLRPFLTHLHSAIETPEQFALRIKNGTFKRVRMLSSPKDMSLHNAASESACFLNIAQVLANGRFELLHFLQEISFSIDYHRYGNLGLREQEARKQIR